MEIGKGKLGQSEKVAWRPWRWGRVSWDKVRLRHFEKKRDKVDSGFKEEDIS